jgi:CheY-like chemotaxis protein
MSKSILIVDDSQPLAEGLADILRMEGYRVSIVTDSMQAVAVAQTYLPDLIITDMVMPGMSGIDFIREIRRNTQFAELPIIVVSADNRQERAAMCKEAGATHFFSKPFDEDHLIRSIEELVRC